MFQGFVPLNIFLDPADGVSSSCEKMAEPESASRLSSAVASTTLIFQPGAVQPCSWRSERTAGQPKTVLKRNVLIMMAGFRKGELSRYMSTDRRALCTVELLSSRPN